MHLTYLKESSFLLSNEGYTASPSFRQFKWPKSLKPCLDAPSLMSRWSRKSCNRSSFVTKGKTGVNFEKHNLWFKDTRARPTLSSQSTMKTTQSFISITIVVSSDVIDGWKSRDEVETKLVWRGDLSWMQLKEKNASSLWFWHKHFAVVSVYPHCK